jgi:hypothetical protein
MQQPSMLTRYQERVNLKTFLNASGSLHVSSPCDETCDNAALNF